MGFSVHLLSMALVACYLTTVASCDNSDDDATPTNSVPTGTAMEVQPGSTAGPTYAVTSVPQPVKQVVRAVEAHNSDALSGLFAGHPIACFNRPPEGLGGQSPPCPPGAVEGTAVGSFIAVGDCEGAWATADPPPIQDVLAIKQEGGVLYGVVYASPDVMTDEFTYHLVYRLTSGLGRIIEVDDKGIIGVYRGCSAKAEAIVGSLVTGGGRVVDPAALR